MVPQHGAILLCFLTVLICSVTGLKLYMNRSSFGDYCGQLRCWTGEDGFKVRKIAIYSISQNSNARLPIASMSVIFPRLFIERNRRQAVNGIGRISKQAAEIILNFMRPADCDLGTFQCELEFANSKHVIDTVIKTVAPGDTENNCHNPPCDDEKPENQESSCNCSAITESMANLSATVDHFTGDLSRLNDDFAQVQQELSDVVEGRVALDEELLKLKRETGGIWTELETIKTSVQEQAENTEEGEKLKQELTLLVHRAADALKEDFNAVLYNFTTTQDEIKQQTADLQTELENELDKVQTEIMQMNLENNETREKLTEQHGRMLELTNVTTIIRTELTDLTTECVVIKKSLEKLVITVSDGLDDLKNITHLENEILELKKNTQNTEKIIHVLENNVKKDRSVSMAFRKSILNGITEFRKNTTLFHEKLHGMIATLDDELSHAKKEYLIFDKRLANMSHDIQTKHEQMGEILASHTKDQEVLNQTSEAMRAEINTLKESNENLGRELHESRNKTANLENELATLKQNYDLIKINLENLTLKFEENIGSLPPAVSKKIECYKNMPHTSPRQVFTIWDNKQALCDTETDGGGWIVIQKRAKGDVDFYRNWTDYKNGFGTPDTDYWLGNDAIHRLTSQGFTELRIDMKLGEESFYAHYSDFRISDENSKYTISVRGYSGTSEDGLNEVHNGMPFSTYDRDNDNESSGSCAEKHAGAWWFDNCHDSNLNGKWGEGATKGIVWAGISPTETLTYAEMKIRRNGN